MDTATSGLLQVAALRAGCGDLRVERVDEKTLASMCLDWNRIASEVPFCQWEWLEACWRHFRRPGDELFALAVRDGNSELVGLAPWYVGRSPLVGPIIRFLGSGLVCSDYLSLLSLPGRHEEVATALACWLNQEGAATWTAMEISGVAAGDPAIEALLQSLRRQCNLIDRRQGMNCWRLQLPPDWDTYLRGLSKSRRERVRQLCRRQFDTGRVKVQAVQNESELAGGLAILKDLHQRRRNSLNEAGCFDHPPFTAFVEEVAERFLRLGKLRLQWIELEGRPVAVEFDLLGGNDVYYYQSGIDPGAADERPGWLGTIAALRWAMAEGFASYDFLRGDEAYKSHWRAEARPTHELRIASRLAELRHHAWRAKQTARAWLKSGWNSLRPNNGT